MSQKRLFSFGFGKSKKTQQNVKEETPSSDSLNVDNDAGPSQKKRKQEGHEWPWIAHLIFFTLAI